MHISLVMVGEVNISQNPTKPLNSNTTDVTCGAGPVIPSGTPKFTPGS